jgi:hypothetical protein
VAGTTTWPERGSCENTGEDNISRKMPDKIVAARKPELKRIHSPVVQLPSVSLFTRMAKSDLGVI